MMHAIYVSGAAKPISSADLLDIFTTSRHYNLTGGITGMLMWADPVFLQIHEGEACSIKNLVLRIGNDPRHRNLMPLCEQPACHRLFTDWSLGLKVLDPIFAAEKSVFRLSRKALEERISDMDAGMFFQVVLAFARDLISDLRS